LAMPRAELICFLFHQRDAVDDVADTDKLIAFEIIKRHTEAFCAREFRAPMNVGDTHVREMQNLAALGIRSYIEKKFTGL